MKAITIKVVFDRKGVADMKTRRGLVQIRVTMDRKQTYLSTGIKVFKNQWDAGKERVKNSMQSVAYNAVIEDYLNKVLSYWDKCAKNGMAFDFENLRGYIQTNEDETFLSFMKKRIIERGDIRAITKKMQLSAFRGVEEFGKIVQFEDLTFSNIQLFDDWMHKQGLKQSSIWCKHKVLKTYINEAIKFGKIDRSPYVGFKTDKGKSEEGRYLTEGEMRKIMGCELPVSLEKVRDLMIVEFYTGLAVSDLMKFDFSKIEEVNGHKALIDMRKKTEERYYIFLFAPVLSILGKYGNKLPSMTMQQYNMRMKIIAQYAGIDKPHIASHWLRRGYGMMLLNKGVPLEVVSKSLGHSSIRTTENTYAKLLGSTVIDVLSEADIG